MTPTLAIPAFSDRTLKRSITAKDKQLALLLIGAGNVGSALLTLLEKRRHECAANIKVCAIANSRRFVKDPEGLDLRNWTRHLGESTNQTYLPDLVALTRRFERENVAVVDCTASPNVVDTYTAFIESGAHVVTPNKRANVLPWNRYRALMDCFSGHGRRFFYSTNVGAGLPVLSTLADLIASGDTIHKIEGIFSGTLSYLFSRYDGSTPFSSILREAHQNGFTEPDPRLDLSGADVATKLLVLARQLGWKMELESVQVQNLLDRKIRGDFSDRFYKNCSLLDRSFAKLYAEAANQGSVLRYVATLEEGRATARLETVPRNHPLANTRYTDNVVAFYTERYCRTPLVIQGPGAGPEVTAAGVLADILRLMRQL